MLAPLRHSPFTLAVLVWLGRMHLNNQRDRAIVLGNINQSLKQQYISLDSLSCLSLEFVKVNLALISFFNKIKCLFSGVVHSSWRTGFYVFSVLYFSRTLSYFTSHHKFKSALTLIHTHPFLSCPDCSARWNFAHFKAISKPSLITFSTSSFFFSALSSCPFCPSSFPPSFDSSPS